MLFTIKIIFMAHCLLLVDIAFVVMQLVLSWHMKAATMCEFSKQEFIGGLQSLGCV